MASFYKSPLRFATGSLNMYKWGHSGMSGSILIYKNILIKTERKPGVGLARALIPLISPKSSCVAGSASHPALSRPEFQP